MEFTPNRGDCLSLNGLLRDLSVFYEMNANQEIYNEELKMLDMDFENRSQDICPQISFLKLEIESIPNKYKDYLNDYFIDLNLNKNNFLQIFPIIFRTKTANQLIVMMQIRLMVN